MPVFLLLVIGMPNLKRAVCLQSMLLAVCVALNDVGLPSPAHYDVRNLGPLLLF